MRCGPASPPIPSRPRICRRWSRSIADSGDPDTELREFFRAARRETDEACRPCDRHAFFAGDAAGHRRPASNARAGDDEFAADTLATMRTRSPTSLHVAFRADHRRLDHVDGRVHEDGVPHPQPHAAEPRLLRGHPRGDHRQGLRSALAAASAGGGDGGGGRCLFRAARPTEISSCERSRRPQDRSARHGRNRPSSGSSAHRRLLPDVRHALLGPADRLL